MREERKKSTWQYFVSSTILFLFGSSYLFVITTEMPKRSKCCRSAEKNRQPKLSRPERPPEMNVELLVDLNVAEAEVLAVDDIDTQAKRCNEICKLIQVKMKE